MSSHEGYSQIPVGINAWMKVSNEDAETLYRTYWSYSNGYAVTNSRVGGLRAHRVVVERTLGRALTHGEVVDHINHDTLDNRRENLRLATASLNNLNRRMFAKTTSSYRGVSLCRQTGKWRTAIGGRVSTGRQLRVGRYDDEDVAAWMYDQWAVALFGDFALTNFNYLTVASENRS